MKSAPKIISPRPKRQPMQLDTPKAVAMAETTLSTIWRINFQVSFLLMMVRVNVLHCLGLDSAKVGTMRGRAKFRGAIWGGFSVRIRENDFGIDNQAIIRSFFDMRGLRFLRQSMRRFACHVSSQLSQITVIAVISDLSYLKRFLPPNGARTIYIIFK